MYFIKKFSNIKILFRTNSGKKIGLGHIMRCSSLATAFEKKGYNCLFLCNHESESFFSNANLQYQLSDTFDINEIESIRKMGPDLVVFDSYLADNIMDPINRTAKMKK